MSWSITMWSCDWSSVSMTHLCEYDSSKYDSFSFLFNTENEKSAFQIRQEYYYKKILLYMGI